MTLRSTARLILSFGLISPLISTLVSCTGSSQNSASVSIQLPAANLLRSTSVSKQSVSASSWGMSDPTTFADVDCYAVLVSGPEDTLKGNRCYDDSDAVIEDVGIYKFGVPAGGTISFDIPIGKKRKFTLLGMNSNFSGCKDSSSTAIDFSSLSAPVEIGTVTSDVVVGINNVVIDATFANSKRIKRCDFMGPLPPPALTEITGLTQLAGQIGGPGIVDGPLGVGRMYPPQAIAFGPDGTLYFSDGYISRIRAVNAQGTITNFAGSFSQGYNDGPIVNAMFSILGGIAADATGNLFVSEPSTGSIRKISSAGFVSQYGGTANSIGTADGPMGTGLLKEPRSLTVGSGGVIYFIDENRIRKLAADGTVTTLAGTIAPGYADDVGNSASFNVPSGIAVDSMGNIYVADTYNHIIRKIDTAFNVTTIAGAFGWTGGTDGPLGTSEFSFPSGIAIDSSGNLYTTEQNKTRIRKIDLSGYVTTVGNAKSELSSIAVDSAGSITVGTADSIERFDSAFSSTLVAGRPAVTGAQDGQGQAASFLNMGGMVSDAGGNLYALSSGAIRKVTPKGLVSTFTPSTFLDPVGIAIDSSGSFFVTDSYVRKIWKVASDGTPSVFAFVMKSDASPAGTGQLGGIAVDSNNNLYVADPDDHTSRKITPGGVVSTFAGIPQSSGQTDGPATSAQFFSPIGLAFDKAGNLFVADHTAIRKITPAGDVSTIAGAFGSGWVDGVGTSARFNPLGELKIDSDDNLFVFDKFLRLERSHLRVS